LKPLFPGGNEVDQVWRVCEIMGSPGSWVNKYGQRVGGGEWKDGVRLAQKLGFSFPKVTIRVMHKVTKQLTRCTDGTPLNGHHPSTATMACKPSQFRHVVPHVGPSEQADLYASPGP
jgi:hypothetical protein